MDVDKTCTATFNQSSASIKSNNIMGDKAEDLGYANERRSDFLGKIKQAIDGKNPKYKSLYSRFSSYAESLRLGVLSLLFATTAYAQTVSPTTFIDLEYSYDGVGNVTEIIDHTDSQNTRSMQYDSLDRLAGAIGVWGPGSFSYDPIGNRTKKSIGSSSNNYSYGASDNRLSGYSHDAKGNLLQDDSFIYEYDSENRLVKVRSGANVIAEYQYDGDGRRIKKVANGETTYYAYGTGLNVLTELNGQGVPKYDYIYAGNKNIARVNFDANGAVQNKSFYHTDHLGSSLAMTDETTTVIWNQNYLPFGEPRGGVGTIENSRQYTGKEFEEETGLYYYGARYYHSGLGRFMSVDPAPADPTDPQSWNRYAYVQNSPFKYVDPDGEFLETAWDAFNITLGVISLKQNLTQGNYLDAAIDAGGILVDSATAITPFVPGGVGLAIKAGRQGGKVIDKSFDVAGTFKEEVFSRAISKRELEAIKDSGGFLRGGKSSPDNPTFITKGFFTDAKKSSSSTFLDR